MEDDCGNTASVADGVQVHEEHRDELSQRWQTLRWLFSEANTTLTGNPIFISLFPGNSHHSWRFFWVQSTNPLFMFRKLRDRVLLNAAWQEHKVVQKNHSLTPWPHTTDHRDNNIEYMAKGSHNNKTAWQPEPTSIYSQVWRLWSLPR